MTHFADPVAERLNNALSITKGFGAWVNEARGAHGEWTSGGVSESIRRAQEADSQGDHEGAMRHLEAAHSALGERLTQGRMQGETRADQTQIRDLMDHLHSEHQHQQSLAGQASPHEGFLRRMGREYTQAAGTAEAMNPGGERSRGPEPAPERHGGEGLLHRAGRAIAQHAEAPGAFGQAGPFPGR